MQVNTHFAAFSEIYKIITLLHRAKPKIAAKNRQTFSQIFKHFAKFRYFSTIFVEFCTDFDEIFSEFRKISSIFFFFRGEGLKESGKIEKKRKILHTGRKNQRETCLDSSDPEARDSSSDSWETSLL